jgi:hypothetical protein
MENRSSVQYRSEGIENPPPDAQPLDDWVNNTGAFRMMSDGKWHRLDPSGRVTDEILGEHTTEIDTHSIRYTDGSVDIVLTVPWGYHTGLIPPPAIAFGDRRFLYAGDVETRVIPPGSGEQS